MQLPVFAEETTERPVNTIEKSNGFSPKLQLLSVFSSITIASMENLKKISDQSKDNQNNNEETSAESQEAKQETEQTTEAAKEPAPTQDNSETENTPDPAKEAKEVKAERNVLELVRPSIVYATMTKTYKTFKKGSKVEILYDKGNGTQYFIKGSDGKTAWVKKEYLEIPPDPPTNTDMMTKGEIEKFVKIKGFTSKTNYFIWVDIDRQILNLFKKENDSWKLLAQFPCSTGKNVTPTKRGLYTLGERGESFGSYNTLGAKYYIRYSGSYMIHSLPFLKGKIYDYTLGKRASHGCIRISVENAEWLYKNIPSGTAIWIN